MQQLTALIYRDPLVFLYLGLFVKETTTSGHEQMRKGLLPV